MGRQEFTQMLTCKMVIQQLVLGFWSAALLAQQTPPVSAPGSLVEFPVVLQQSVEAGKTPAGTKVQGKLAAATLFNGALIPKNAVTSGVVVESESKRGKDRARLAIRMNTVGLFDALVLPHDRAGSAESAGRISGSGLQDLEWSRPVGLPHVPAISGQRLRSESGCHPGHSHHLEPPCPDEKRGTCAHK